MLRRRILFAGCVARMEDTKLPKCMVFGEPFGGAGCEKGQKKKRIRCLLDDLRYFGINTDQWITAAQDEWNGARRRNKGQKVSCRS